MSALRPFRQPTLWCGLWAAMIAAVAAGSLLPAQDLPAQWFPHQDKLEHLLGYALLGAGAAMLFATARARWGAAVMLMAFGGLIELAQGALTATRTPDPLDALTNAGGVLLGLSLQRTRWAGLWLALDRLLPARAAPRPQRR